QPRSLASFSAAKARMMLPWLGGRRRHTGKADRRAQLTFNLPGMPITPKRINNQTLDLNLIFTQTPRNHTSSPLDAHPPPNQTRESREWCIAEATEISNINPAELHPSA
ncbi:hypothetical protein PTTG_30328, partial [Puccinia triticina 1-1 BBBD Race 1]